MADVSFERTKSLSRGDAAVTLRRPDQVAAEFEVEVGEGKVQVELEFTWSLTSPAAGPPTDH